MKALADYRHIKGVNYTVKDEETTERELGYAKRLGINSVRVWLDHRSYSENPERHLDRLVRYIRCCDRCGVSVMPILFNGNRLDPAMLESDFHPAGEAYVKAVVDAIRREPGLLMHDIMNEPACNDYIIKAENEEVKAGRYEKIWAFVRHYCDYVKSIDPDNAITVGHWLAVDLESTADCVDVLSYHDYSPTLKGMRAAAELALSVGRKSGKPVINSETACIARSNPYDLTLQVMQEYDIPWYIFNLMIEGYWSDVHGVFYPDGTVRDPSVAAALLGCFRNRSLETMVPEKPNRERYATKALEKLRVLLADNTNDSFHYKPGSADELLEVCEEMANILECGQLVSLQVPPTAKIYQWRKEAHPDLLEIKKFAYSLAGILRDTCQII